MSRKLVLVNDATMLAEVWIENGVKDFDVNPRLESKDGESLVEYGDSLTKHTPASILAITNQLLEELQ